MNKNSKATNTGSIFATALKNGTFITYNHGFMTVSYSFIKVKDGALIDGRCCVNEHTDDVWDECPVDSLEKAESLRDSINEWMIRARLIDGRVGWIRERVRFLRVRIEIRRMIRKARAKQRVDRGGR